MARRTLTLTVPPEASHQRLDAFLASQFPEASRGRIQESIRAGEARLDGRVVRRPGRRVRRGERLEFSLRARPPLEAVPEALPLPVLYEDDDFVAVDKPAGMPVHIGAGTRRGTVVNALLHRFPRLSSAGGPQRPGIVHRLDKLTSGVLLVAKNDDAHARLSELFRTRRVEKSYLALVHGRPRRAHDVIRLPVSRDLVRRTRMTTRHPRGREAATEYRALGTVAGLTLLEARPLTGRTHQLRVHFAALGHPVVGDTVYGAPRRARLGRLLPPPLERIFLHARRVRFPHPRTERTVEVSAPLPAELRDFLQAVGWEGPVPD